MYKGEIMKGYRVNLLPKSYQKERQIRGYLILASLGLMIECVLFIILVVYPSKMALKQSLEGLEIVSEGLEDDSLSEVNQIMRSLETAQEEVEKWKKKCEGVEEQQWISRSLLDTLVGRVPVGVHINQLKLLIKEEVNQICYSVNLEGSAEQMTVLLNYIMILEGVFGTEQISFEAQYEEEWKQYGYRIEVEVLEIEEAGFLDQLTGEEESIEQ